MDQEASASEQISCLGPVAAAATAASNGSCRVCSPRRTSLEASGTGLENITFDTREGLAAVAGGDGAAASSALPEASHPPQPSVATAPNLPPGIVEDGGGGVSSVHSSAGSGSGASGGNGCFTCLVCGGLPLQTAAQAHAHAKGWKHRRQEANASSNAKLRAASADFEGPLRAKGVERIVVVGDCHGGRALGLASRALVRSPRFIGG